MIGVPARTELRAQGPTLSPPYDVSICVRTSSSRPHSRVGVCSDIPTTMGKAAGAWLRESCKREGCVPETPGPSGGLAWTVRPALGRDEPEHLPGLSGMLPEGPDKQIDIAREHLLRSEKLLVLYMESCFRSLATQSLLPGQHRLQPGQRIHYCGCELCVRAELYVRAHETKLQDSLRGINPPRRTDQGLSDDLSEVLLAPVDPQ